jgi:periplasmic divalent cation tolerance protein
MRHREEEMSDHIVVYVTAPSMDEARAIAAGLLEEHLAACVNIVPTVESHYWWEGKREKADEALLVIKTRGALLESLIAKVRGLHSYTVPEVIALPLVGGNPDYLAWIQEETRGA